MKSAYDQVAENLMENPVPHTRPDVLQALLREYRKLHFAAEATLLFHGAGSWDEEKRKAWRRVAGTDDATTKTLCDVARRGLGETP